MRYRFLLIFLMICAQSFADKELVFYSADNFEKSPFSWDQIKENHKQILRPINGDSEEQNQLIDRDYTYKQEIFQKGGCTLGLLTDNDGTEFKGSIIYLHADVPVIIQMVSKDLEGYKKMILQVLKNYPAVYSFKILLPIKNRMAELLKEKGSSGVFKASIPESTPKEYQDAVECYELSKIFIPTLFEELLPIMCGQAQGVNFEKSYLSEVAKNNNSGGTEDDTVACDYCSGKCLDQYLGMCGACTIFCCLACCSCSCSK